MQHLSTFSPATPNEQFAFLSGLRQLYPSAAILTSTFIQPNPAAQPTKTRVPHKLPPTIGTLYHPKYQKFSEPELQAECERAFHKMKISKEESNYLTEATQLQSKSLLWFEH